MASSVVPIGRRMKMREKFTCGPGSGAAAARSLGGTAGVSRARSRSM